MTSASSKRCPDCGTIVPENTPEGLCPKCLLVRAAAPTDAGSRESRLAAPPIESVATAFPQLEVFELIGQGGMGCVFKARQPQLNRFVALKILPEALGRDAAFAARFAREAQALAALSHPNIVTIHDFGQANGFFYLLMEFVDGVNLRQALCGGRFTPEQALAIVPPICDALQYAHERGIVHRDIKPENLLLDKRGRVKIADFGIAKMVGTPSSADAGALQQTAAGTPQYMAPEQRSDPRHADHRADIYSLGVVLYELLTGELPGAKLQPPSARVQIDVRLDEVVLRALEREPDRRYATAHEFKTRVETVTAPGVTTSQTHSHVELQAVSPEQRLLQLILPRRWFAAIRQQSLQWQMECPNCDYSVSLWRVGGIRFGAKGTPRRMMVCPQCGRSQWSKVLWRPGSAPEKSGAQTAPANAPASDSAHGFARLALALFLGATLGSLVLFSITPRHDLVLIFAATALVFAQVFGILGWRHRLGKGVVIVSVSIVAAIFGLFLIRGGITSLSSRRAAAEARGLEQEAVKKAAAARASAINAQSKNPQRFVRIVASPTEVTFEGTRTTWDELPALLAAVPNREHTVLELAATDELTNDQLHSLQFRAVELNQQLGFSYISYVGVHALGTRGTAVSPPRQP